MEQRKEGPRASSVILLIFFAATILMQRIKLYDAPLFGDICAYAVIGHEMLHGRQLYSDLWERKPPLLYITYAAAESITGYGRSEIFLLGLVPSIASLLLIYQIGRIRSHASGLFAAAFWVLLCTDLDLTANQPDPESFINVFVLAAFALLVYWPASRRLLRALLLGVLLSAATLYKHNAAIACFALLAGHLLVRVQRRFSDRLVESFLAGCVMIAIWLAVFGYFATTGRSHDFIDVLFHQNFSYSGNMAKNLGASASQIFPSFMIWAIAPAMLVLALFLFSLRDRKAYLQRQAHWLLLLAWAIGTFPTIALTGYLYPHYYQLWIPIGCIAGGWAAAALLQTPKGVPPIIAYGTLAIAIAFLVFRQGSEFLLTPEQWVRRQFPYFNLVEQNKLGTDLGKLLSPNQQFWELGEDNALYFFSKHSPPTGLLFIDPFLYGDETQAYWDRLLRDLNRTKPELIVLSDNWTPFFKPDAPIFPWLKQNYSQWNTPLGWPHYQLFVRHGSELEKSITPATASWSVPPAVDAPFPPAHH